uniref:Uncharacterized protein n=1 Tax=Manihot esculenta TaxID=3983 RepID=A0A2C9UKH1_MANES
MWKVKGAFISHSWIPIATLMWRPIYTCPPFYEAIEKRGLCDLVFSWHVIEFVRVSPRNYAGWLVGLMDVIKLIFFKKIN